MVKVNFGTKQNTQSKNHWNAIAWVTELFRRGIPVQGRCLSSVTHYLGDVTCIPKKGASFRRLEVIIYNFRRRQTTDDVSEQSSGSWSYYLDMVFSVHYKKNQNRECTVQRYWLSPSIHVCIPATILYTNECPLARK